MTGPANRLTVLWKTATQLGLGEVSRYALYRFGLATGHYRRLTPIETAPRGVDDSDAPLSPLDGIFQPDPGLLRRILGEAGCAEVLAEAEIVLDGKTRLFGANPVPLELSQPGLDQHWTAYEKAASSWTGGRDVKFIWEPGRLGWMYPLARAYRLTGDPRFPEQFWRLIEAFWQANPPNRGPHWSSAQEVAIRLLGMIFAGETFRQAESSTPPRLQRLRWQIAAHARRIPPTLVYARAQNNNHLLSEAVGLYTAGLYLKGHPEAEKWLSLGKKWVTWCLENQFHPDGTYTQHSANYHRLSLQLALWTNVLANRAGDRFSEKGSQNLAQAVGWFAGQVDPWSGEMANLGANDGAYLFPLAPGQFGDARPVLQAASLAFFGRAAFPAGAWDEMSAWFGVDAPGYLRPEAPADLPIFARPERILHAEQQTWASVRAVRFRERPSHADQLQVQLWWRGLDLVLDPGTYLYNGDPPWDNSLANAQFHNAVTVDGEEPMLRAGRFLWLDWTRADLFEPYAGALPTSVTAAADGYRRLGIRCERRLDTPDGLTWHVSDRLYAARSTSRSHHFRINWLLPDWPYQAGNKSLWLDSPLGQIEIMAEAAQPVTLSLARAGISLSGQMGCDPRLGWVSPTYGVKQPALALCVEWTASLPSEVCTTWILPQ